MAPNGLRLSFGLGPLQTRQSAELIAPARQLLRDPRLLGLSPAPTCSHFGEESRYKAADLTHYLVMTGQADPLSADDRFFAALLGVNRDALDQLLAPDFLLIDVMTGSEIPRAPFLDLVGSGQLVFDAIDPADRRVRRYQDVAVITGRTQMRGRFGEAPFAASSRYTHVFLERESRWRLVAAQGTLITPPPETSAA